MARHVAGIRQARHVLHNLELSTHAHLDGHVHGRHIEVLKHECGHALPAKQNKNTRAHTLFQHAERHEEVRTLCLQAFASILLGLDMSLLFLAMPATFLRPIDSSF
jgi:hypothetical protein